VGTKKGLRTLSHSADVWSGGNWVSGYSSSSNQPSPVSNPLDLVRLTPLMELTQGMPEVVIGLLDGPVATNHSELALESINRSIGGIRGAGGCTQAGSAACLHGTFTAGILSARRESLAPAICPGCSLLVRPIFEETPPDNGQMPSATAGELADAVLECIHAGARVLNLSVALTQPLFREEQKLEEVLDFAARRGCIVVAAAGNQGAIASSAITRHPWVIPVVGCDLRGRPTDESNLGGSMGKRGLRAPSNDVISLAAEGEPLTLRGTSVAAPFVTGAIALLWSVFPAATASRVRLTVRRPSMSRRSTVVPPLLDAWAAYEAMTRASA
jgi:subtilisin family serine protease